MSTLSLLRLLHPRFNVHASAGFAFGCFAKAGFNNSKSLPRARYLDTTNRPIAKLLDGRTSATPNRQ